MTRKYYVKRILICLLVIGVCLCLLSLCFDVSAISAEGAFRLAEKAQLVGPSQIIGQEDLQYVSTKAIIGESTYGYSLFAYTVPAYGFSLGSGKLTYHPKTEQFTTFCQGYIEHFPQENFYYPIWIFTEKHNGANAKLTLYTHYYFQGDLCENTYTVEAQRSENGYFLFWLDLSGEQDYASLDFLTERLNGDFTTCHFVSGSATLELYSTDGTLLETYTRDLSTPETE